MAAWLLVAVVVSAVQGASEVVMMQAEDGFSSEIGGQQEQNETQKRQSLPITVMGHRDGPKTTVIFTVISRITVNS